MNRYALFGNCQAAAMRWLLQRSKHFNENFEIVEIPPSYEMRDSDAQNFCEVILPQLSLLFFQPHSFQRSIWHDHVTIRKLCATHNVRAVAFPQINFSVYNPWETSSAVVGALASDDADFIYLDSLLMNHVLADRSISQMLSLIQQTSTAMAETVKISIRQNLNYITSVEIDRQCDVFISDFISDHFKSRRLMHNLNHPQGEVMATLAKRLLGHIDIHDLPAEAPDLFPQHDTVIYDGVDIALGSHFKTEEDQIASRFEKYRNFVSQQDVGNLNVIQAEIAKHSEWLRATGSQTPN
ncbi:MAG TPA: WcbI family polysaccharide biosynthesis putative acetyltransferase [Xanthobacteraceae bacterium]|nr:WcbI family polysaccharide biosynthesis putative acetyltransferase [Xanthobacteraceae bacterium]